MPIKPILFFALLATMCSCKKTDNFPVPEEPNKPVLNLLMNKDSLMTARLTWSAKLSDPQTMPDVQGAVLKLYENEVLKETFTPSTNQYGRIDYKSSTVPRAGSHYRVTATIPGFEEVTGGDAIPDTVKITDLRMTILPSNVEKGAIITMQLHDDPDLQNYYRIRMYVVYEQNRGNGVIYREKHQAIFEAESTDIGLFGQKEDNRSDYYTTDALFNGRSPRFTFKTRNASSRPWNMIVEVSSLTYSSYNYLSTAYQARKDNDDVLSEKVIVYNNIVNGLGIVGGVAQREYELKR